MPAAQECSYQPISHQPPGSESMQETLRQGVPSGANPSRNGCRSARQPLASYLRRKFGVGLGKVYQDFRRRTELPAASFYFGAFVNLQLLSFVLPVWKNESLSLVDIKISFSNPHYLFILCRVAQAGLHSVF
jgi:hypothetical protein